MTERILLKQPRVALTDARLTISDVSFELREIVSVRAIREPASATGPIMMTVVGVLCLFSAGGEAGIAGVGIGAGLMAGAIFWWIRKRPRYKLRLVLNSGTTAPLESSDEQEIEQVVEALDEVLEPRQGRHSEARDRWQGAAPPSG